MNQNLPTSLPSAQTVSEQIVLADTKQKIRELHDPFPALNAFVAKVLILLDVKPENKPSIEYQKIIIDGISRYHRNHSVEELYLAIELNVNGKYEQRIDHYGRFSIDYLSSCIHLFNESKKKAMLKAKYLEPKPDYTERKKLYDNHINSEYYAVLENFCKEHGYAPLYWDWGKVYKYLKDSSMLSHYTKKDFEDIRYAITGRVKSEATGMRMSAGSIGQVIEGERAGNEDRISKACRREVVLRYLEEKFNILRKT